MSDGGAPLDRKRERKGKRRIHAPKRVRMPNSDGRDFHRYKHQEGGAERIADCETEPVTLDAMSNVNVMRM